MIARNWCAVLGMAFLFLVAWVIALGRLLGMQFWDSKYALQKTHDEGPSTEFYNSTGFQEVVVSYYTYRHIFFSPHVMAAFVWWNLYFIQLVPAIRHRFKTFHRYLGRVLMVVALTQVASGMGLACTSKSSTIKLVSFALAIAVTFCVYHAWRYAIARDIPMHKYWVTRLVGYMQAIALQRFYMMALIISHHSGFYFLYPNLEEGVASMDEIDAVVLQIFDDSFVTCLLTALLVTEWYLSAEQGMMRDPIRTTAKDQVQEPPATKTSSAGEGRPLLPPKVPKVS
jgi:hypothetical protein